MQTDDIKRKLRELKRLEMKIRFGGGVPASGRLVWDSFFITHDGDSGRAGYTPEQLAAMSKEAYKAVVDEYFAYVYYELYKDSGMMPRQGNYDPEILKKLGLPHGALEKDIKKKFRELAKKYHPDTGGDAAKFIDLMDTYKKLIEK